MTLWKIALYFLIIATLKFNVRNNFVTGYLQYDDVPEEDPYVCTVPECNHLASKIKSNIDFNVDPCENFYKFTCDNYIKQAHIPNDHDHIDSFVEIRQLVKTQLKSLFVVPIAPHESKLSRISKTLYQSCIDENSAIKRKYEKLRARLGTAGFDWPILYRDAFSDIDFTWIQSFDVFVQPLVPFDNFIDVTAERYSNGTNYILMKIPSPRNHQHYLGQKDEKKYALAYSKFMADIAVILGAPREVVDEECWDVVKFEIALSEIFVSAEEEKKKDLNIPFQYMTFAELKRKYPRWESYFTKIKPIIGHVDNRVGINIQFPSYVSKLLSLLDSTPERTIANYIIWRAFDDKLLEDFETPLTVFNKFLKAGIPEKALSLSRSDLCVSQATNLVSTTVLYANHFIGKKVKEEVSEIITNIQDEIIAALEGNNWIKPEAKLSALKKFNTMSSLIGYPDDIVNSTVVRQYYNDLKLDTDDYFENLRKLKIIAKERYYFEKSKIENSLIVTGANGYLTPNNQILLLGGILQGIFFDQKKPQYLNYAGIGNIIAHEFIHNFDINDGIMSREFTDEYSFWDTIDDSNYKKKVRCLIHQYDKYFVPEVGEYINGTRTRHENIADNGGFKIAYLAYKRWAQTHGTEKMLPGLPYSPNQLFWINAASTLCSKYRLVAMKDVVLKGNHTLNEFRVIGAFSNYAEFAEDFNCTVGSNMNPEEKCVLW